ncbi:FAD-dependent oxidoreductase [Streptomyces sp. SudanB182_2057]|uniref:FAD-dependent oxidoreductase n=1 Tax=Streptomyces sp. SudanB182_2057 TaxID=3035281 RepID=UPI003F571A88
MNEQVDVVVLGLGHAGGYVTGALAESGLDVVGIEPRLVGGERLPPGCFTDVTTGSVSGFPAARLAAGPVAVGRVGFVHGKGRLSGPRRVTVGGRTFRPRKGVVLATGAQPRLPSVRGLAGTPYWTDRNALATMELPESLIVLGSGGLGVETAQLFARFRCAVTVVERRPRLLPQEEPEASTLAERALRRDGVTVLSSTGVSEVGHDGTGFTVRLDGGREPLRAQRLLVTMEQEAGLVGLGADTVGLDARAGAVPTDGQMRAGKGLWAVGDVTGPVSSDVASYQAEVTVRDILGWPGPDTGYEKPARLVFTDPEIAAVGLTERQARNQRLRVRTSLLPVNSFGSRGPRGRRREGFVKLVEDADRGVLVGATSAGPAGAEVLYGLNVAVHTAMSVERLRSWVPACLPFHRTVEAALGGLG